MLDDLREQANSSFLDDFDDDTLDAAFYEPPRGDFLGMKPGQRFVIAVMLLLLTCLISSFCVLVTEKVVLPFM